MEKKYQKKDKYKLNEPVLYPPLKQKIVSLDVDEDKYSDIGILTLRLLRQSEMSIYKLLYNRESNLELMTSTNNNKSVRSEYLKKLVEANEDYFPRELLVEKYKRKKEITYEEKLKSKIQFTETKPKKAKKEEKKKDSNRKESIDLGDNLKTQNVNKKAKLNEPQNVVEEEESQHADDQEEQSFEEDEFLMNSEEEVGSDSQEANYSDGGD
jgi:hypothetical protein